MEFNKVHGFYIEVSIANSDRVPDDYRRRQTLKNAERYITPELKAFEDKALSAQERSLAREKLLFEALLDSLSRAHIPGLQRIARALAQLDALAALADVALRYNYCQPIFRTSREWRSAVAATRWWNDRWKISSPTTAFSDPQGGCC